MTRDEIVEILRATELLRDVSAASCEVIAHHVDVLDGGRGDRLFSEGQNQPALYVVVQGDLLAKVDSGTGLEHTVQRFGPGSTIGEFSLLLRGERLVSVDASTDCRLLELSLDSFRQLRQNSPDAALHLVMAIVRRLGRVVEECRSPLKRMLIRYAAGMESL